MRILLDSGMELVARREGGAPPLDPVEAFRRIRPLLADPGVRGGLRRLLGEVRGQQTLLRWSDEEVLAETARLLAAGRLLVQPARPIADGANVVSSGGGGSSAAAASSGAAASSAAATAPASSPTSSASSAPAAASTPPPAEPQDVPPEQAAAVAAALVQAAAEGAPLVETPASAATSTTWIAVEMVGEDDKPIAGVRYRLTLPDGTVREGMLDAAGRVYLDGLDPGTCQLTFPDLDQEAWTKIGTADQP